MFDMYMYVFSVLRTRYMYMYVKYVRVYSLMSLDPNTTKLFYWKLIIAGMVHIYDLFFC